MKQFFTVFLIISNCIAFSQQISPEVIASAGDHFENDGISLSWTLGEPVISTMESDYILTQGFHQDFYIITAIDEQELDHISISIYPNPTPDFINIELKKNTDVTEKINIQLLDLNGRLIKEENCENLEKTIRMNLQYYERAHYLLKISTRKEVKTYKIIKS